VTEMKQLKRMAIAIIVIAWFWPGMIEAQSLLMKHLGGIVAQSVVRYNVPKIRLDYDAVYKNQQALIYQGENCGVIGVFVQFDSYQIDPVWFKMLANTPKGQSLISRDSCRVLMRQQWWLDCVNLIKAFQRDDGYQSRLYCLIQMTEGTVWKTIVLNRMSGPDFKSTEDMKKRTKGTNAIAARGEVWVN